MEACAPAMKLQGARWKHVVTTTPSSESLGTSLILRQSNSWIGPCVLGIADDLERDNENDVDDDGIGFNVFKSKCKKSLSGIGIMGTKTRRFTSATSSTGIS